MEKTKDIDPSTKELLRGLELAYQKMVAFKKYKKTPLIISKNGKVVEIPWDEIEPTTAD